MDTAAYDRMFSAQCAKRPRLEAQDLAKALYQELNGPGHFAADAESALAYIREEARGIPDGDGQEPVEELGGRYARVHLSALRSTGITDGMLARMFTLSASEGPRGAKGEAEEAALLLERGLAEGKWRVEGDDPAGWVRRWRESGCPAVHHSQAFRDAYRPAYRVVSARFARLVPLLGELARIERENGGFLAAIEGGSASGKTTLAKDLARITGDTAVVHMDDFFLQPHQRTPQRYAEPGGNVDRERFWDEVLRPLREGRDVTYRKFDCSKMELGEEVRAGRPKRCVVEGAYSTHPAFGDPYDLTVFLDVPLETRLERIRARNGEEGLKMFREKWIPLEDRYFEAFSVRDRCGTVLADLP